jgi:hypothetical protein
MVLAWTSIKVEHLQKIRTIQHQPISKIRDKSTLVRHFWQFQASCRSILISL